MFSFKKKRVPIISIKRDDTWSVYERLNSDDDTCSCKLHLAIGLDEYKDKLPMILSMLTEELEKQTIPAFKILTETSGSVNRESIGKTQRRINLLKKIIDEISIGTFTNDTQDENLELTGKLLIMPEEILKEEEIDFFKSMLLQNEQTLMSKYRVFNMPVTIYLPKECNFKLLGNLCFELEKVLKDLPVSGDSFSQVDIPLLPHIYFRKEGLYANDYIALQDANVKVIEQLKQAGLSSDIYSSLVAAIESKKSEKNLFGKRW